MKHVAVVILLVGLGCQDEEEAATTEQALLDPASPYLGPNVLNYAAYPPLTAHGRVTEGPYSSTSAFAPHLVAFTDGYNLAAGPIDDTSDPIGTSLAWADTLTAVPDAQNLVPPNLTLRVKAALAHAHTHMGDLSAAALDEVADLFRLLPGFTEPEKFQGMEVAAWLSPRSRWLDSQWAFAPRPIFAPPGPETHYRYPTPAALALMPQRGARLYCAAREAARNQKKGSLGEKVLLPLDILGQHIDIGVFEPFAYADQPAKFIDKTVNDGVQAFSIPFQLGIRISPVRPFLPPLPELRAPLVITTADSEMATDTDRGLVWESNVCFGGILCVPVIRPNFQKRFKTTSHADSVMTAGRGMKTSAKIPLFWAGALLVQLRVGFAAAVGMHAPSITGEPADTRPRVFDDRILAFAVPQPGWSTNIRKNTTSAQYLDGFWKLPQSYFNPDPGSQFYDVHSGDTLAGIVELQPQSPFRTAVLADDDHHFSSMSELALLAGLEGILGLNASIARIEITAGGHVKGTLGLAHDIRDAVSADTSLLSPQPVTNLTITPTTYGHVELLFTVNFHLHIDLIVKDIDVNFDLVNETIPLGPELSETWDESHRVRLGTGSTLGNPTMQPTFTSHTGTTTFPSFPQPVNVCLADETAVPNVPPPCKEPDPSGDPPHVEICMYTPISIQIDPCIDIPTNPTDPVAKCEAAKLSFLCPAVSKEQWFDGQFVLAHRLTLPSEPEAHSDDLERISQIVLACSASDPAFDPMHPDDWFKGLFTMSSCDATATLMKAGDVVGLRPSSVGPGTCPPAP